MSLNTGKKNALDLLVSVVMLRLAVLTMYSQ